MIRAVTSARQQRLRIASVTAILILAVSLAYGLHRARPSYVESATVLFKMPAVDASARAYSRLGSALTTTSQVITQIVMSPQSQLLIRAAGGTASYDLALINLYNQDYPDYSYPEATLTASSPAAGETARTFTMATRMLTKILASRQARAGVPPGSRIAAQLIGDSGPIARAGSHKRAFAGLMLLTMVASSWAWNYFGRWRVRSSHFLTGRGEQLAGKAHRLLGGG